MTITNLEVEVRIVPPSGLHQEISQNLAEVGSIVGVYTHREKWETMCTPSEEKMRIYTSPSLTGTHLRMEVVPIAWRDLQAYRQIQPVGDVNNASPMKYAVNAVALTVNGLIETSDRKLVFHQKRGGIKEGSIHTFGGYVARQDIERGGSLKSAITRELMERSEIGLVSQEMEIGNLFGTPEGQPAILWGFGTGAIYGVVRTPLSSEQLQRRMREISADESLSRTLFMVDCDNLSSLERLENLHPQTRMVLPTIMSLY